jgi:hypothetical protein
MNNTTYFPILFGEEIESDLAKRANHMSYTLHPTTGYPYRKYCLIEHPSRIIDFTGTLSEIDKYLTRREQLKAFL